MSDKRETFIERGREVIDLAWEIGGDHGVTDDMQHQARITNGLFAIAIVEIMARPHEGGRTFGYSPLSLRDVLKEEND